MFNATFSNIMATSFSGLTTYLIEPPGPYIYIYIYIIYIKKSNEIRMLVYIYICMYFIALD